MNSALEGAPPWPILKLQIQSASRLSGRMTVYKVAGPAITIPIGLVWVEKFLHGVPFEPARSTDELDIIIFLDGLCDLMKYSNINVTSYLHDNVDEGKLFWVLGTRIVRNPDETRESYTDIEAEHGDEILEWLRAKGYPLHGVDIKTIWLKLKQVYVP